MIAYHIDRTNSLSKGQIIDLFQYPKSKDSFSFMAETLFNGYISKHGYFYLSDVGFDDQYPPLAASCIEMELELIRRSFFPEKLSRFQSFFAFESLNSLSAWMPFFKSYNCRLWEIEFFHAHYEKHDAGLIPHFHSDDRPYSPSLTFQCGYEYWSGKFSKNPIYELLIKPPVLIKQEIHLPTQIP